MSHLGPRSRGGRPPKTLFRSLTLVLEVDTATATNVDPVRLGAVLIGLDGTVLSEFDFAVNPGWVPETLGLVDSYDRHGLMIEDIEAGYPVKQTLDLLKGLTLMGTWTTSWDPEKTKRSLREPDINWAPGVAKTVAWTHQLPTLEQACRRWGVVPEGQSAVARARQAALCLVGWKSPARTRSDTGCRSGSAGTSGGVA